MDGQAIRVIYASRANRRGAPGKVPLTQEPGSAQRLTRRLVVARRAAAVANRAPPAVRELAIEIPDRVVVAFVAGAVTGVGHERVSRDRPKIPDLWRGVGHVSISARRGLRSHVRVRRAMFVPRAAQPVRPSVLPKGLWISALHGWSKCRRVTPRPRLFLRCAIVARVGHAASRGCHRAGWRGAWHTRCERLWHSRDRNRRTRGGSHGLT